MGVASVGPIISSALSAILQVALFALIPFLVFLVRRRAAAGFWRYVGLFRPTPGGLSLGLASAVAITPLIVLGLYLPGLREAAFSQGSVVARLRGIGSFGPGPTLVSLLIVAWVQTSLAEELLFRGFVARVLVARLGFGPGNALQALIFGLVHVVLFLPGAGPRDATAIPNWAGVMAVTLLLPTAYGWILGYVKERAGRGPGAGSVIPCWLAHGLANTIAWGIAVFIFP